MEFCHWHSTIHFHFGILLLFSNLLFFEMSVLLCGMMKCIVYATLLQIKASLFQSYFSISFFPLKTRMIYLGLKATGFCLNLLPVFFSSIRKRPTGEKKTKHTPSTSFSLWTRFSHSCRKLGESTRLVHLPGRGL